MSDFDLERFNSQDFEDYFNECIYIQAGKTDDELLEDDAKISDADGYSEIDWLQKAGLDTAVHNFEEGKEVGEEELEDLYMFLTEHQASTLRKRVVTLNATIRTKRAQKSRPPDVRDIFSQHASETSSSEPLSRSATPDSLGSLSPCRTPPSPPDWVHFNQEAAHSPSSSASQGYHSAHRDDFSSFPQAEIRSNLPNTSSRRLSQDPDFLQVFKGNSEEYTVRRNSTSVHRNDKHLKDSSENKKGAKQNYKVGYNNQEPHAGVEVLGYQVKGSISGPRNALEWSSLQTNGLEESEVTLEFKDDEIEADTRPDWGLELQKIISGIDEDIPEIYETVDKSGLTYIFDIGKEDIKKIQSLAFIELTTLLDSLKIKFIRRKDGKRRRKDESSIFGVSLESLVENDRQWIPGKEVPLILDKILSHLSKYGVKEEGILRIPGSAAKIQMLRQEVENNFYGSHQLVDDAFNQCSINDIAALLKQLLRELPTPVLTNEYMDAFYLVDSIPHIIDKVKALKLLVILLPDVHRNSLRMLLDFLAKISEHESYNRMSLQNVAMIMAPNLFVPRKQRSDLKRDLAAEISTATATSRLTKMMIKYRDILWTVPSFLMRQMRMNNECALYKKASKENTKAMKWLVRKKKDIYRKINNEVDFQEGIIRVQAPQFFTSSVPIQLSPHTTAKDIVLSIMCTRVIQQNMNGALNSRLQPGLSKPKVAGHQEMQRIENDASNGGRQTSNLDVSDSQAVLKTHFLYEFGGNICERRLHHDFVMMGLYQENPNARWVLLWDHIKKEVS